MTEKVYTWEDCPNIDLLDKRVIWWNEEHICIEESETAESQNSSAEVVGDSAKRRAEATVGASYKGVCK